MNFVGIKYFKSRELESPDDPGSGSHMQLELVQRLDELQAIAQRSTMSLWGAWTRLATLLGGPSISGPCPQMRGGPS
jgi:hypothetical protein